MSSRYYKESKAGTLMPCGVVNPREQVEAHLWNRATGIRNDPAKQHMMSRSAHRIPGAGLVVEGSCNLLLKQAGKVSRVNFLILQFVVCRPQFIVCFAAVLAQLILGCINPWAPPEVAY